MQCDFCLDSLRTGQEKVQVLTVLYSNYINLYATTDKHIYLQHDAEDGYSKISGQNPTTLLGNVQGHTPKPAMALPT